MFFKRKNKTAQKNPEMQVAVIENTVSSEIYQDILRQNNIPFICRQQGAGGYLKILTGGLFSADSIFVNPKDFDCAKELYEIYIESENAIGSEEN